MENSIIGLTPPSPNLILRLFIQIKIKKVFFKYDNVSGVIEPHVCLLISSLWLNTVILHV